METKMHNIITQNNIKIHGIEAAIIDIHSVFSFSPNTTQANTTSHALEEFFPKPEKQGDALLKSLGNRAKVRVYEDTIQQLGQWRLQGIKIALVHSGEFTKKLSQKKNIANLFDIVVDDPKITKDGKNPFKEATQQLRIKPKECVLIKSDLSPEMKKLDDEFAFVIGLNRAGNKRILYEQGADTVLDDLEELELFHYPETDTYYSQTLPSVFMAQTGFHDIIRYKKPVLFLDYDGTLSPIVPHPEDAVISDEMRAILHDCAKRHTVSVISGRDMEDVKERVGVEDVIYAGSHGMRISGPNGLFMENKESEAILSRMDQIEKKLHHIFHKKIKGIQIERKKHAIAVHYRNAATEDVSYIYSEVKKIVKNNADFRMGEGKKIFEIKPDIDWHKGKALMWIMEKLELLDDPDVIPIYIGDDVTDEDGFRTISDMGVGILVGYHHKPSAADFRLDDVDQVAKFLKIFIERGKPVEYIE